MSINYYRRANQKVNEAASTLNDYAKRIRFNEGLAHYIHDTEVLVDAAYELEAAVAALTLAKEDIRRVAAQRHDAERFPVLAHYPPERES